MQQDTSLTPRFRFKNIIIWTLENKGPVRFVIWLIDLFTTEGSIGINQILLTKYLFTQYSRALGVH